MLYVYKRVIIALAWTNLVCASANVFQKIAAALENVDK